MTRKEIEQQAEFITSTFSFRKEYSTPKDAYISAVEWIINHITNWIDKRAEEPEPSHDQQCDFRDGFIKGLYSVENFIEITD